MAEDKYDYDENTQGLNRFVTDYPTLTLEDYFHLDVFLDLSWRKKMQLLTELSNSRKRAKSIPLVYEKWNKAHPDKPWSLPKRRREKNLEELVAEYNEAHPDEPPLYVPEPDEESKLVGAGLL